jgi:S-adenosylmethionine synthetase
MRNIIVEKVRRKPIEKAKVLICEKKGVGHPDTIMDGICEYSSRELSKHYLKHFGTVLHHNVDKGLLVAGTSTPKFGGGRVITPIKFIICGRATSKVGGIKVNVNKIIQEAALNYLKQLRYLEKKHYKVIIEVREGSANLKEVFKGVPMSNDTSFGVGHAPLSSVEKMVDDVGKYLHSLRKKYKAIGEDIKVMGVKSKGKYRLTLAIAFVDKYVASMREYVKLKEKVLLDVQKFVGVKCLVELNTLDSVQGGENSIYLTTTGLSAEMGDDGQVGRGNRVSGLITPNRPMSLEAAAGKNINHPGRLYQILSQMIAERVAKLDGVKECYVKMLTQIGRPLDEPLVSVEIVGKKNEVRVNSIVNFLLDNLKEVQKVKV